MGGVVTAPETTPPVDADSPRAGVTNLHRCANPQCRHLDVFHAFNTANTVRKACSLHDGAHNTRCPCKAFATELPEETSHAPNGE